MAEQKKQRQRKKRQQEILTKEHIAQMENKFSNVIQEAITLRNSVFENENQYNIDDLAEYFTNTSKELKNRILPIEKRRYVIYLRKSTDDEAKQVRSIDDQRDECQDLAFRLKVNPSKVTILEESASAKKAGNRPVFDEMIKGFQTGKYHGLLAWSPDRLSRNMKAGEIIDLIDQEVIQDLQFKTYQFENTPNGKMMLGILFATSKQYSDKLAVDVKRGTDGNIKDGKYNGVVKKGYYVDSATNLFVPDKYNWGLLRIAVDMRLCEGKNLEEIATFLNDAKLAVRKSEDDEYKLVKVTKQMLSNLYEDSFYCGLYQYGNNIVNLVDLYNFEPLITTDEYIALNAQVSTDFGKSAKVKTNVSKRLDYGLLRNKVICDFCEVPMQYQNTKLKRGKNAGKWSISYYCRNKGKCLRHNKEEQAKLGIKLDKSIRAKYVLSAIEWELRHATKKSKRAYELYIHNLETSLATQCNITSRKLHEARQDLKHNENRLSKLSELHIEDREAYERYHSGKIEHHENLIDQAKLAIDTNNNRLKDLKTALPTEEQFYELINLHLLDMLQTDDIMKLDAICNELVTNLRAGNDSVSVIKLNPPYNLMADLPEISTGRGERT